MTIQSPPFDIEDIKKLHLFPGDVLLVKLNWSPNKVAELADQLRTELESIFKDNEIILHDNSVDFAVVKHAPPVTQWQKYPDITPAKSGYYMVYYFSPAECDNLHTALYWEKDKSRWELWPGGQPIGKWLVYGFLESTRQGTCMSCTNNYARNPVEFDIPLN